MKCKHGINVADLICGRCIEDEIKAARPQPEAFAPRGGSGNFESIVEEAFKKHRSEVGDHWSGEWAIRERDAEEFAREIIERICSPNAGVQEGRASDVPSKREDIESFPATPG